MIDKRIVLEVEQQNPGYIAAVLDALEDDLGGHVLVYEKRIMPQEFLYTNFLSERPRKPEPVKSKKVGRNEPCPCMSGKKYKLCCGR